MDRARLPDGNEPDTELQSDGRCEDESARLDPRHLRHALAAERIGERGAGPLEEAAVCKEPERVRVPVEVTKPLDDLVPDRADGHTGSPA